MIKGLPLTGGTLPLSGSWLRPCPARWDRWHPLPSLTMHTLLVRLKSVPPEKNPVTDIKTQVRKGRFWFLPRKANQNKKIHVEPTSCLEDNMKWTLQQNPCDQYSQLRFTKERKQKWFSTTFPPTCRWWQGLKESHFGFHNFSFHSIDYRLGRNQKSKRNWLKSRKYNEHRV